MCFCFCNAVSNRENTDKTMKTLERQGASPVSSVSVEVQTELEPWSARCFLQFFATSFCNFLHLSQLTKIHNHCCDKKQGNGNFSERCSEVFYSYSRKCLDVQIFMLIPEMFNCSGYSLLLLSDISNIYVQLFRVLFLFPEMFSCSEY